MKEYALRSVDKALPADPKDIQRPNKPLLLILGLFGGLILGSLLVLARFAMQD
jgi:LPS O-antigen subunit length determinant protein (WzzB/FepE family)